MHFFTEKAWLLSYDGTEIGVIHHPNRPEEVARLAIEYGTYEARTCAEKYLTLPTNELKEELINYYRYNWCKVRVWGNFNEEVTFRICPGEHDWYPVIANFLNTHPMFKNSKVTVESNFDAAQKAVYWDSIPYSEAIDKWS